MNDLREMNRGYTVMVPKQVHHRYTATEWAEAMPEPYRSCFMEEIAHRKAANDQYGYNSLLDAIIGIVGDDAYTEIDKDGYVVKRRSIYDYDDFWLPATWYMLGTSPNGFAPTPIKYNPDNDPALFWFQLVEEPWRSKAIELRRKYPRREYNAPASLSQALLSFWDGNDMMMHALGGCYRHDEKYRIVTLENIWDCYHPPFKAGLAARQKYEENREALYEEFKKLYPVAFHAYVDETVASTDLNSDYTGPYTKQFVEMLIRIANT